MALTIIPHPPLAQGSDTTDPQCDTVFLHFEVVNQVQAFPNALWGPYLFGSELYSAFWDGSQTSIITIAKTSDGVSWTRLTEDKYVFSVTPPHCPESPNTKIGFFPQYARDSRFIYVVKYVVPPGFGTNANILLLKFDTTIDQWLVPETLLVSDADRSPIVTGYLYSQVISYEDDKLILVYSRQNGEVVGGKQYDRLNLYDTNTATVTPITAGAGLASNWHICGSVLSPSGLIHLFYEVRVDPQNTLTPTTFMSIYHQSYNPATAIFGTLQLLASDCDRWTSYGTPCKFVESGTDKVAFPYVFGNGPGGSQTVYQLPQTAPLGVLIGEDSADPTWIFEEVDSTLPIDSYAQWGISSACFWDGATLWVLWVTPTLQGDDYDGNDSNIAGSVVYSQRSGTDSWTAPTVVDATFPSPRSPTGVMASVLGSSVVLVVTVIDTSVDPFTPILPDGSPFEVWSGAFGITPICLPCPTCPAPDAPSCPTCLPPAAPSCPSCSPPAAPTCPSCPDPIGYC